eukprot:s1374_g16.t1
MQKGGKSVQYLCTEFVRFLMHTQHREIALRSDLEPSNLAILEAVRKTCKGLGIVVHHEPVPVGSHESNGAAEATLQQIRVRAGILIQQIENACAGGKMIFPCAHPLYGWALLHACWVYNRFNVTAGTTAFERSADRVYTGRLAMFGESLLAYLKTDRKAAPRWQRGIWLGKSLSNDTHLIAQGNNIFATRSIRRLPKPFVLEELGEVVACPGDYGYAALGHRMFYSKTLSPPMPFRVGSGLPPQAVDVEAIQVQQYAEQHPLEDVEHPAGQAKTNEEPNTPMVEPSASGQKRADDAEVDESAKRQKTIGEEQPATPDDSMLDAGERAPKTPRLEQSPKQQSMNQLMSEVTSTDLALYQHEDEDVSFHFEVKIRGSRICLASATWREKHAEDGTPIWLRRSRFVAREFAWLQPERESLFSPASGSIISRVLPTMFLQMREHSNSVLACLDVRDAFLTVLQQCPTLVHTTDAGGVTRSFSLGRVLPGQRDGSLLWYKDITDFLKTKLDMVEHEPYPCVLATRDGSCTVMIHVDDMLIAGRKDFVLGKFLDTMRSKYDISIQTIERPGDEMNFLKRTHLLHEDGRLTIKTHHKHISQLCSLLGLNMKTQNKRSPGHADMDKEDTSPDLPASAATVFQTCVGILMYLANDMPHGQHVIRHLSTYNAKPTQKSLAVLKHLVSYLACHQQLCISLKWGGRNSGIFHSYPNLQAGENVLETFTDSDWASDRTTGRSISCCIISYGQCLLYSASRAQRVVSLSSAEAEVYACSSGASDAILLARLVTWLTGKQTTIHLYTDSSGARGILQRKGVDGFAISAAEFYGCKI